MEYRHISLLAALCASAFLFSACDQSTTKRSLIPDTDKELTADELKEMTEFLNRVDVNGFLISNYDNPLDIDLSEAFYNGGGIATRATEEMREEYLEIAGWDETMAELSFMASKDVSAILEKRTGYTLEEMQYNGNDLDRMIYSDKYDGYYNDTGDTNLITVECLSGTRSSDGTITLESREVFFDTEDQTGTDISTETELYNNTSGEDNLADMDTNNISDDSELEDMEDWRSTFHTTLREHGKDLIIESNEVTGGWLADVLQWSENDENQTIEFTAAKPPTEYAWFGSYEPDQQTLPVTLDLISEKQNNISLPTEWMAEHWDEWMQDQNFINAHVYQTDTSLEDRDAYYSYSIEEDGKVLSVYDADTDMLLVRGDFEEYIYPEGHSVTSIQGLDAQELRWALVVNGDLYVSNSHPTYADTTNGKNAYITSVNIWDGSVRWRSAPLVCNSKNFEIAGVMDSGFVYEGVIICGYGFTNEDDYIYQLSLETGEILDKKPIASKADYFVYANNKLYVHCYDRDYIFEVSYG